MTFKEPENPIMKFYTVDCDWEQLLKETQMVYRFWQDEIAQRFQYAVPENDPTLSKNTYNLVNLSTPLPEYYNLWSQVFVHIKNYYKDLNHTGPLWMHSWLNVHRAEDLNGVKESLNWHRHSYCNHHGFVHISDKETDTIFKNGTVIKNKQGQMYMGDARLEHRVLACGFKGIRASIGIDLLDAPQPKHFEQDTFVPIL